MVATAQQRGFNGGRIKDAGFSPGSDERISKSARAEQRAKSAAIARAMRPPVSKSREQLIPQEFVDSALARLEIQLSSGAWEQARETLSVIEQEWEAWQIAQSAPESGTNVLAWHVASVFEPRTANLIEDICSGTIGALLECFPAAFIELPNCGPLTIQRIARMLSNIGAIDAADAQKRVAEYNENTSRKPRQRHTAHDGSERGQHHAPEAQVQVAIDASEMTTTKH